MMGPQRAAPKSLAAITAEINQMPIHHGGYPDSPQMDAAAEAHYNTPAYRGPTVYVDSKGNPAPAPERTPYLDSLRGTSTNPLSFADLQDANFERGKVWGKGQTIPSLFNMVELGGEAGELLEAVLYATAVAANVGKVLNAAKKYARFELDMAGGNPDLQAIQDETADVVICCSLLANKLNFDLGEAVARKFNKTSEKHGFPHRLPVAA